MIPLENLTWKMVGLYSVLFIVGAFVGVRLMLILISLLASIILKGRIDW